LYFVFQNSINGSGDTMPPMLITLLNFWLLQIPLAYLLPKFTDMGAYGVRWAIVAGWVAGAAAYAIYFKVGGWKQKRV
jgi:MATE family multidrug resistance protein